MAKKCFVICPIGSKDSEIREKSDKILKYIIKEALLGLDFDIERADSEPHNGSISHKIINELVNADLVIADLSNKNPNVLYELAVRHASKKPYIQIAEEGTKVPFDISDINTFFYDMSDVESVSEIKTQLRNLSENVLEGNDIKCNNPITNAIKLNLAEKGGGKQETILVNIVQSVNNLDKKISYFIENFDKRIISIEKDKIYPLEKRMSLYSTHRNVMFHNIKDYDEEVGPMLDELNKDIDNLKQKKAQAIIRIKKEDLNEEEKDAIRRKISEYDFKILNLKEKEEELFEYMKY